MRKSYGKSVIIWLLLLLCVMCLPCSASAAAKLNCTSKKLYVGQTYKLKVFGTKKKVKWSSSNSRVAKVNSQGKVTAKKAGAATITVKGSGKNLKCKITVKKPSIKLNKTSAAIYTSGTKTVKLKATVKGASAKVTWKSSNRNIATVDSGGKVTAKKAGKVTITAKANGKTAKCKVTVKKLSKRKRALMIYKTLLAKGTIKYFGLNYAVSAFAVADTDGDSIPELYIRGKRDDSDILYDLQVTFDNNKGYKISGVHTNLYGYYKKSGVIVSYCPCFLYDSNEKYSDEYDYFYKYVLKYSYSKLASGIRRYYKVEDYMGSPITRNEFYSWLMGKVKNTSSFTKFKFYSNTVSNQNKYLL